MKNCIFLIKVVFKLFFVQNKTSHHFFLLVSSLLLSNFFRMYSFIFNSIYFYYKFFYKLSLFFSYHIFFLTRNFKQIMPKYLISSYYNHLYMLSHNCKSPNPSFTWTYFLIKYLSPFFYLKINFLKNPIARVIFFLNFLAFFFFFLWPSTPNFAVFSFFFSNFFFKQTINYFLPLKTL